MDTVAFLDMAQTKKLEEAAGNTRDQLFIRLNRLLGCRVSEVLNIGIEDINFETNSIIILHEKTHISIKCPSCKAPLGRKFRICPYCGYKVDEAVRKAIINEKTRQVPIDKTTLDIVKVYTDNTKLRWNGKKHLLFDFNRIRAWQIITEAAGRAGLPRIINTETNKTHNVSSHRLRDAFAVNAVKKDDSNDGLRMLQDHLGHASIATTMKYRKLNGEERKEWYGNVIGDEE